MKAKLLLINVLIAVLIAFIMLGCVSNNLTSKPIEKQIDESVLIGMDQFDELKIIGKINPRRSEDIDASRWGIEFNLWKLDSLVDIDVMLEKTAESGVKWARFRTGGYFDIPSQDGYFKWEAMDKIIEGLVGNEINVFICITRRGVNLNGPNISGEIEEYIEAISALVKRYGNVVKHWEIMNEPQITPVYIKVVKKASKIIKQIDSEANVLAGSLMRSQYSKLEYLINNAGSYLDIISFHPYNEFPEALKYHGTVPINGLEGSYTVNSMIFDELREQIGESSKHIELWQGEAGYPSSEHTNSWKGRGPWGENIQAKWILRRFLVDFSLDIPVNIYFYLTETASDSSLN